MVGDPTRDLGSYECSIESCGRPVEARGWCSLHYGRWRRKGDPLVAQVRRARGAMCVRCGIRERKEYPSQTLSYCGPCANAVRVHHKRKHYYGISEFEYYSMLERQSGGCAICGGVNANGRFLSVDHDHETGALRGLLCNNCNAAIGLLKDSPAILKAAGAYLRRNGKEVQ